MTIHRRLAEVRAARVRAVSARTRLAASAAALYAQARARPLACASVAAGAGWMMGRFGLRPWRVPGMAGLLSGQALQLAARVLAWVRGLE